MTELEKFKRRMIRIVARLHLKEKKPEDELWEDLKKETKCDCKWLWERMRTLTLKRLKRLIIADDRHDCITNIARMSITDWLLYDLILVHEKIDVIGADMMGEKKVEPRPLFELFSLVQRFELEGLTGERLAAAWTAATFSYNHNGRQCSPMLLQRRWYQMKEATRNRFYKFWYTYRGNYKQLQAALNDTPTRLQMAIAKRYPHIITKSFLTWEDMIEQRMVILPDEFQIEMKKQTQTLLKPPENDPDLILLEPEIETIDLRVDSDSDNELKAQVESEKNAKLSDLETASALAGIGATPKLEPEEISSDDDFGNIEALQNIQIPIEPTSMEIDDDQELCEENEAVIENAKTKIIQEIDSDLTKNSEAIDESAESEIPNDDSEPSKQSEEVNKSAEPEIMQDNSEPSKDNEEENENAEPEIIQDSDSEPSKNNKEVNESAEPETILDNNSESSENCEEVNDNAKPEITSYFDSESSKNSEEVNKSAKPITIQDHNLESSANIEEVYESAEPEITRKDHDTPLQSIKHRKIDEDVEAIDESTGDYQQPLVIPQITNVFGNVHIEVEALAKLSDMLDKKIINPVPQYVPPQSVSYETLNRETLTNETYSYDDDDEEIEDDIIKTVIDENDMRPEFDNSQIGQVSEMTMNKDMKERTKCEESVIEKPEENVTNLTFDDGGIEFEDDGIIVDDDDHSIELTKSQKCNPVKTEHQIESEVEEEGEEEMAKFDLKLLMDPVVYTKKIDEMSIFKNNTLFKATCKEDINSILAESKPINKRNTNDIEEEKLRSPCDAEDDDHKIDDDLFDNNNINHIKEEKLSSSDSEDDDDLFENMSNESESEYVPENKKVKLSSNLLQKPRNRNYNPITLCKNPDFNTRLKRLTVGFLSSTRNRRLLKACKPLTIDVCKSFESKIIDNTLYLKSCLNNDYVNKENKTDDKFNESQHTTSVMPSAMPVQSLIDIMKTNMEELMNKHCQPVNAIQKPLEDNSILCERNKVINLPHIDNVRRINQKLLVAEVSPIQVHPAETCIPPVQIIPRGLVGNDETVQNHSKDTYAEVPEKGRKESDICGGKVICSGTVVRGTNRQFITHEVDLTASTSKVSSNLSKRTSLERMFDKYKLNANQHQPNRKRPNPTRWNYPNYKPFSQTLQSYTEENLLTVDTLNKMLNLMDDSRDNPVKTMILQEKAKKFSKSKLVMKRQLDLQAKLYEYERRIKGDLSQPSGPLAALTMQPPTPKQKKVKGPKVAKSKAKTISSCQTEKTCTCQTENTRTYETENTCTCKTENKDIVELNDSMKKACDSIESVVQQTRELIENKTKSSHDTETATKTVSTSTVDANTSENISVTIEIDDTCVDNDNTPIEIDDTSIDVGDSESSAQQTGSNSLTNDTNTVEENGTSIVANSVQPTILTPNLSFTNKITVTEVAPIIDNNIIEIDDSPTDVANELVVSYNPKKPNDVIPVPPLTKIGRGRPPKIKTVIKSAPKSARQRSLLSNIPSSYKHLQCVTESNVNNEKVLFLSSKNLSKQPNTQPIFLGKNKILLTDVQLPRYQPTNPDGIVISPHIDKSSVSLPKGVDFVLLPNGELTCTVAPETHLNNEQLALIPSLLSSLKQQISNVTMLVPPPAISNPSTSNTVAHDIDEIVDISDDENVPKKSADEQLGVNIILNENVIISSSDVTQPLSPGSIVKNTNENVSDSEKTRILKNVLPITNRANSEEFENEALKCVNNDTASSTMERDTDTIPENPEDNSANINRDSDINIAVKNDTTSPGVNVDDKPQKTHEDESTIKQSSIVQNTNESSKNDSNVNESEEAIIPENVKTINKNFEAFDNKIGEDDNKNTASPIVEHNIETIHDYPENDSANTNKCSDINMEVEKSTNSLVVNIDDKTINSHYDDSTGAPKKTILSDLMEMSGICEADIMPTVETDGVLRDTITTQPSFVPSLVVGAGQDASGSKVITPSLVADANQVAFGNTVVNLPELNPITSFAELKYAFEKSGNFFKLDLVTKVLAPINVCIKKNEKGHDTAIAPKMLTVDLTDENDEPIAIADEPVSESPSKVSVIEDQSTQAKIQKPIIVKPLKLFKVKRPNILRGNRTINFESKLVSILKRHKLQRSNRVSEEPKNNEKDKSYQFEHSSEINIVEDSDDSSDDEPLAKKALRKHESTDVSAPNGVATEPIRENVPSDNDRLGQVEDSTPSDRSEQLKECLPNNRLERRDDCLPNDNLKQVDNCLPNDNFEQVQDCLPEDNLEQEDDCLSDDNLEQYGDLPETNNLSVLKSGLPTELSFISDNENDAGSDEDLCILGV